MVEVMGDRLGDTTATQYFSRERPLFRARMWQKCWELFVICRQPNMDALESVLLRVSEMVCEWPMLMEMDITR